MNKRPRKKKAESRHADDDFEKAIARMNAAWLAGPEPGTDAALDALRAASGNVIAAVGESFRAVASLPPPARPAESRAVKERFTLPLNTLADVLERQATAKEAQRPARARRRR